MMKPRKTTSTALIMSVLLVVLLGCQKREGPAEKAGKEVDKATEKVGRQIEKTGDNTQDAAKVACCTNFTGMKARADHHGHDHDCRPTEKYTSQCIFIAP